jgi:hypothetical protein
MFRLRYSRRAKDMLADLWIGATPALRSEITRVSNEIDELLSREADTAGESRGGRWRFLIQDPLGVVYRLERDGQTVSVTRIWLIR